MRVFPRADATRQRVRAAGHSRARACRRGSRLKVSIDVVSTRKPLAPNCRSSFWRWLLHADGGSGHAGLPQLQGISPCVKSNRCACPEGAECCPLLVDKHRGRSVNQGEAERCCPSKVKRCPGSCSWGGDSRSRAASHCGRAPRRQKRRRPACATARRARSCSERSPHAGTRGVSSCPSRRRPTRRH